MTNGKTPKDDIVSRLGKTMIATPLIDKIREAEEKAKRELEGPPAEITAEARKVTFDVIIDLNLGFPGGRESAREMAIAILHKVEGSFDEEKSQYAYQHLFACLTVEQINEVLDRCSKYEINPIHMIWLDDEIKPFLEKSVKTIKADAALVAYAASGENIYWAVLDSGIDGEHKHFDEHKNLILNASVDHADFTQRGVAIGISPTDNNGHGTHVAGIIGGEQTGKVQTVTPKRVSSEDTIYEPRSLDEGIRSVAPKCKLVSLKVLDDNGKGKVSNIIAALGYVDKVNSYGRKPVIHGVNLSVGYEFDAEWFACGQSPLCSEVNRLVRSGTVVVVAAGNTGYGFSQTQALGAVKTGLDLSINDPGNAELAITVGATHREHPHRYGVSYFSSKGPTGDGRCKPDLVAPGERIISCATGKKKNDLVEKLGPDFPDFEYREESGTSMAAPHVSGAIAAFLSIRSEFIGEPDRIKKIFQTTCTDLERDRYFQGHGLTDLMRAIQSI